MFQRPFHLLRVFVLAVVLNAPGLGGLGCASFDVFESGDSSALPATITELRDAIGEQRALLLDLVSEAEPDGDEGDGNSKNTDRADQADQLVAIAERLTQLTAALAKLEAEPETETTPP